MVQGCHPHHIVSTCCLFEDFLFTFEPSQIFRLRKRFINGWLLRTNQMDWTLEITTHSVFQPIAQNMISKSNQKRLKVFIALHGKFVSHLLNVVPCKSQDLKRDDPWLKISFGLRLGSNYAFTCSFLHQKCWSLRVVR